MYVGDTVGLAPWVGKAVPGDELFRDEERCRAVLRRGGEPHLTEQDAFVHC